MLLGLFCFQSVEGVDPVGFQEIDQEHDGTAGPGDGICPGNGGQPVDELNRNGDIADTDEAPADHHGDHGHGCLTGTAHDSGDAVGESQEEVEQTDSSGVHGAVGHNLGAIVEEGDEVRSENVGGDADDFSHDAAAGNAETHTLSYPVMLMGTQILTDESGQSHGEAGNGQESKAFNLGVGTAAGHSGRAEAVDIGLDYQIGKTNDGILNTGGQAEPDNGLQTAEVIPDFTNIQPVRLIHPDQMDEAENGADTLGEGGSQGGRTHTQLQTCNEQQIQRNVDKGGENQIVQRMLAVTDGMENTHKDIVHDGEDGAAEIIAEIDDGLGKYIFGSTHPLKNRRSKGDSQNRKQNTGGKTEGDIGVDGDVHILVILGAEELGDDDTGTHGNAIEETHKHVDQTAGRADCRQSGVTDEFTYRPGVESMIELLENISNKNGEGKQQDLLPDRTLCQSIAVAVHEKHFL